MAALVDRRVSHIEIGSTMMHGAGANAMCGLGRKAANASGCAEVANETHSRVRSPAYLNMPNAKVTGRGPKDLK